MQSKLKQHHSKRILGLLNLGFTPKNSFKFAVAYTFMIKAQKIRKNEAKKKINYHSILKNSPLDFSVIQNHVFLDDIELFEKKNPDWSFNVYTLMFENSFPGPVKLSKIEKKFHVDLFMIYDGSQMIYTVIENFDSLFRVQGRNKIYYCKLCLTYFYNSGTRDRHVLACQNSCFTKVKFPKNNFLSFNRATKAMVQPYSIYVDIEALMSNVDGKSSKNGQTKFEKKHVAYGIAYCVVSTNLGVHEVGYFSGPHCISNFLGKLKKLNDKYIRLINLRKNQIHVTEQELADYTFTEECCYCGAPFTELDYKVMHHSHLPLAETKCNSYIGPVHNTCNLALQNGSFIPTFVHNLNYDIHFLIQEIYKSEFKKINCIARSSEKFISLKLDNILLLDSYNFFPSSLQALVNGLKKNNSSSFPLTRSVFKRYLFDPTVIVGKGVFPHEYITWKTLYEPNPNLPPKSSFYSMLNNEEISDEDYNHACFLYKELKCKNLEDLSFFYCVSDVVQLADIMLFYQKLCLEKFGVDIFKFYSVSSISYFIAISESGIDLEFIKDPNINAFVSDFVRGANVFVPIRYAKANRPDLPSFNPNKLTRYLFMYDVNSLYGTVLADSELYIGELYWLSEEEILNFDLYKEYKEYGFIVRCDIQIPFSLHELFIDFPPLAEKIKYKEDDLSPYQQKLIKEYNFKPHLEELSLNLWNKNNYVIHYKLLRFVCSLGLKVTKIHEILKFRQKKFLHDYIVKNIEDRQRSLNEPERNFLKLLNNSVYGKTLQNKIKEIRTEIVTDPLTAMKKIANPLFSRYQVINSHTSLISSKKKEVTVDTFNIIGGSILDLSKLHMLKLYYQHLKPAFGSKLRCFYSDTDSFGLLIDDADPYPTLASLRMDGLPVIDFSSL